MDWNNIGFEEVVVSGSVELNWSGVTNSGAVDGSMDIYISNDTDVTKDSNTLIATYEITVGTGSKRLWIRTPFRYIKFIYTDNTVTAGNITCNFAGEVV
jgi:hypothetical protein